MAGDIVEKIKSKKLKGFSSGRKIKKRNGHN